MSFLPEIPPAAIPIVSALIRAIVAFVSAGDDGEKQEEALMSAEEEIARERARRKFGQRP